MFVHHRCDPPAAVREAHYHRVELRTQVSAPPEM